MGLEARAARVPTVALLLVEPVVMGGLVASRQPVDNREPAAMLGMVETDSEVPAAMVEMEAMEMAPAQWVEREPREWGRLAAQE